MSTEEVLMVDPRSAVERAMKVQEVIVRALAGKLTRPQAAEIPGRSPRSTRRPEGGESGAAILTARRAVLERYGLPMALDTDRAHWAAHTPTAGGPVDRRRPTQVGRALARLGIEPGSAGGRANSALKAGRK